MGNNLPTIGLHGAFRPHTAPFVGHAHELTRLRHLLRAVAAGRGSTVLVGGREGLGKTRLLGEVAALAGTAAHIVAASLALDTPDDGALAARIALALGADADGLTQRLRALAVRRPLLCLIDDVHRATRDEIATIESLIRLSGQTRIVVIATFRSEPAGAPGTLAPALHDWVRAGALMWNLQPLDRAGGDLLLRQLLAASPRALQDDVRTAILDAAAGNPRYLAELVARYEHGGDAALLVAPSAQARVAALRATVAAATFDLLRVASVVGERFAEDWLDPLLAAGAHALPDALQEAVDAGALRELAGPLAFAFVDGALRIALYHSLVSSKRRSLHARVAALLVAQRRDSTHDALIAQHYTDAGNEPEAIRWLLEAAGAETERAKHGAAVSLLRRAARLVERDSVQWWAVEARLATALAANADFSDAAAHRQTLAARFQAEGRRDEAYEQLFHLMHDYWYDGRGHRAEAVYRTLHRLGARSPAEAARIELGWAELCLAGRREAAHAIAESLDPRVLPASMRTSRESVIAYAGARDRPIEATRAMFEHAEASTHDSGNERDGLYVAMQAANANAELGDLATAQRWIEHTIAQVQHKPELASGTATFVWAVRAELLLLGGRIEEAREALSRVGPADRMGAHWAACVAGLAVFIGMRLGDASWIAAFFRPDLLERAVRGRQAEACGLALRGFAETMVTREMRDALADALHRCVEAGTVDPYYAIQVHAARYGPLSDIAAAREQIARDAGRANDAVVRASLALFDAFAAQRANRTRNARTAALDAAARYRALGWNWLEGLALEVAGERAAAATAYERCGASRDVARLAGRSRKERRAAFGMELTPREQQIAALAGSGLTNREIAARLRLSERTINHHLEAIFSKRGIRARWQLPGVT